MQQNATNQPPKTLGAYITLNGDTNAKEEHMLKKRQFAIATSRAKNLAKTEIIRGFNSLYILFFILYGLSATQINNNKLNQIQSPTIRAVLQKLGFNQNHLRASAFATVEIGGVGQKDLYKE